MKKISFKKIIVLVLVTLMAVSVFSGCSLVVYNEARYLENVVLKLESVEMEYAVPLYTDYTNELGRTVAAVNQWGETVSGYGQTLKVVKRTHDGKPIHKPLVVNGSIKYKEDPELAGDDKVLRDNINDRYYIYYDINSAGEVVSAAEYYFDGFVSVNTASPDYGVAQWRDIVTGKYVRAIGVRGTSSYGASGDMAGKLPNIHFSNENGSDWFYSYAAPVYETQKWNTGVKEFTKQELTSLFGRSGSSFLEQGYDLQQTYSRLIRTMYSSQLMLNEAENYVKSGDIVWEVTEENVVKKYFYQSVDRELGNLFDKIVKERNPDYIPGTEEEEAEKTYPVPNETTGKGKDYYIWQPAKNANSANPDYLGMGTTSDRTSLVKEGIRRWVLSLFDRLKNDHSISKNQRKIYTDELETLREMLKTNESLLSIYPSLADKNEDGGHKYSVIWYMYGETYDKGLKVSALTEHIGAQKEVDNTQVVNTYNDYLREQRTAYTSSNDAFVNAVTGNNVIFYFPSDEYFYVKHVLLPFPEKVLAELNEIKASGNYTDEAFADIKKYKSPIDNASVYPVYAHVNGEDDKSVAYTVKQAYDEIKAKVNSAATERDKEHAFEDMIFKYNTDPGIFNNEMGYAVSKTSAKDGGAAETFVIEFATSARQLRTEYVNAGDNKKLGIISEPILGEHGYHILFLLKVPTKGETRGLYDYTTIGQRSTLYDMLSSHILTAAKNEAYNSWSADRTSYYEKKTSVIVKYEDVWKDLYEDA